MQAQNPSGSSTEAITKPLEFGVADFDTLLREVEQLRQFKESIKRTCENPKNRTRQTQLQMCRFLDELRLTAINVGAVGAGNAEAR
ncbi:hypothetical protein LIS66_17685 [Pseudomonas sp. HN2]|uniref:hypothetical protein n=1 Tax=Pseudomonas sp. HN2 TaxID=2884805 RepID=UPI001D158921|nr:hypothetical protein [Pseudomonas sp. HN2]UEB94210.1 hypothetical protein LIS66_17685 [Pseudomonas sp. HN2]